MLAAIGLALAMQAPGCAEAARAFERGAVAEARVMLDAVPQRGAFCLKLRGVAAAAMGDYRAAVEPLQQACRLDAKEPDACFYWARALYGTERFEEALVALDRVPGKAGWRVLTARGQCLDALGRAGAEPVLKQALQLRARDGGAVVEPDPLLALGAHLHRQGQQMAALRLLEAAPAGYERVAAYQYQLGRALGQADRWEEAVRHLQRAVELRPAYAEAHGILSRAYYRLGQAELGASHAQKAAGAN